MQIGSVLFEGKSQKFCDIHAMGYQGKGYLKYNGHRRRDKAPFPLPEPRLTLIP